MKSFLPVTLGLVIVVIAVAFFMTKQSDNAQHAADVSSIADASNQLSSAQTQIAVYQGSVLTLSNNLDACQAVLLTLSNQLVDARSTLALDADQITNLNAKVTETEASNQALEQRVMDLTNQTTTLAQQLGATKTSLTETSQALAQANKDYGLLENRFRVNVAERVVLQRKFNNPTELQEQLARLKDIGGEVTADMIYAGLDVEVKSNGTFHVITPN